MARQYATKCSELLLTIMSVGTYHVNNRTMSLLTKDKFWVTWVLWERT